MAVQVGAAAGQLNFAIGTAFGTISCTMNPVDIAGQVLKAAQSLQDATIAAGMCEEICKDIQQTAINRLPVVCELLRLGQLFPEADGTADLNHALLRCFNSVCDAMHEARTAMYSYLQSNKLSRMRQAASVKELMCEKRTQLVHRFNDVNSYMSLATLLRSQQSAEQARHTAAAVRELQQQMRELEGVRSADRARVMALAQAAVARQSPKGQKVQVSHTSVKAVIISLSCGTFATHSHDVSAWDAATGMDRVALGERRNIRCNTCNTLSLDLSPDGTRVVTGDFDGAVVWDAATGAQVHVLRRLGYQVGSVAWSPDGSRFATASDAGTAAVWDASNGARIHELGALKVRGRLSHKQLLVVWSPDASKLAAVLTQSTVVVWDAVGGVLMHELWVHSDSGTAIAWSPDGSRVATGSDDTTAVWDAATGTRLHELEDCAITHRGGHVEAARQYTNIASARSLAWSPDGSRLAVSQRSWRCVGVWDATDGSHLYAISELRVQSKVERMVESSPLMWIPGVTPFAWSPDGAWLVTGCGDNMGVVWDAVNGRRVCELRGDSRGVNAVAWSPDGSLIFIAAEDGTVRIYSVAGRWG